MFIPKVENKTPSLWLFVYWLIGEIPLTLNILLSKARGHQTTTTSSLFLPNQSAIEEDNSHFLHPNCIFQIETYLITISKFLKIVLKNAVHSKLFIYSFILKKKGTASYQYKN